MPGTYPSDSQAGAKRGSHLNANRRGGMASRPAA